MGRFKRTTFSVKTGSSGTDSVLSFFLLLKKKKKREPSLCTVARSGFVSFGPHGQWVF